jgi:hypothetical protein
MTGPNAFSAILASHRVDGVVVRDTRIRQANKAAVDLPGNGPVTVERVAVTGPTNRAAFDITDRDGSTFTNCCIQKPGVGVQISNSSNCRVADSTVVVDGQAFAFRNARVETAGIEREGTCGVPSVPGNAIPADERGDR